MRSLNILKHLIVLKYCPLFQPSQWRRTFLSTQILFDQRMRQPHPWPTAQLLVLEAHACISWAMARWTPAGRNAASGLALKIWLVSTSQRARIHLGILGIYWGHDPRIESQKHHGMTDICANWAGFPMCSQLVIMVLRMRRVVVYWILAQHCIQDGWWECLDLNLRPWVRSVTELQADWPARS